MVPIEQVAHFIGKLSTSLRGFGHQIGNQEEVRMSALEFNGLCAHSVFSQQLFLSSVEQCPPPPPPPNTPPIRELQRVANPALSLSPSSTTISQCAAAAAAAAAAAEFSKRNF